jgi:hypothetical protein
LQIKNAVILAMVGMRIYPGTRLFEQALAEGRISPRTDLLSPTYYLAPGLTEEGVSAQLKKFARQSPSWIPGEPVPVYASLVDRLRKNGAVGPLWSYFSALQRLWPKGIKENGK